MRLQAMKSSTESGSGPELVEENRRAQADSEFRSRIPRQPSRARQLRRHAHSRRPASWFGARSRGRLARTRTTERDRERQQVRREPDARDGVAPPSRRQRPTARAPSASSSAARVGRPRARHSAARLHSTCALDPKRNAQSCRSRRPGDGETPPPSSSSARSIDVGTHATRAERAEWRAEGHWPPWEGIFTQWRVS